MFLRARLEPPRRRARRSFLVSAFAFGCALSVLAAAPTEVPAPVHLTAEYQTDPIGLGTARPRLSWQLAFPERAAQQAAYRIEAAADAGALEHHGPLLWDSGRIASAASVLVPYGGAALGSSECVVWRVRAWNERGEPSAWSAPARFETGLLHPSDWTAHWIAPDLPLDLTHSQPAQLVRGTFRVTQPVREARLYVTSLGLYAARLNGQDVGDRLLTPGWTDYSKRIEYQTYDVTPLVRVGNNAIGATLSDGWYRGNIGLVGNRNLYGQRLALLAQLRLVLADGRVQVVGTDATWQSSTGPILMADLYNGETYDARLEKPGWTRPGYDDSGWEGVSILDHAKDTLFAGIDPPIRRTEEIHAMSAVRMPDGGYLYDLGQNMVGWARLHVHGPAGTELTIKYAEVLDRSGHLYTANLRTAQATDRYILKGGQDEVFEPQFTTHGFRYVEVWGFPRQPTLDSVTGIVVGADLRRTGTWASSNRLLNQLQHNVVWSQRGNFLSVPTDCPQRDERLGWTGDAQIFARTAACNFDVAGFLTRWLGDVSADQKPDGALPYVIPDVLSRNAPTVAGAAGWGDCAVIVPWTLYLAYGDRDVLARQYPSMKAWVDYMHHQAPDLLWNTGFQFGDWLAYASPPLEARFYPGATTSPDLVATAFFAHSADLVSKAARVLGQDDDARAYAELRDGIKAAFDREFVTPNGRVGENTQTAYTLAIGFGLLPQDQVAQAARRLAADVALHGNHLTTGFLGTPYLCQVLADHGHLSTAYALLTQESYPSWLYPVRMGATTIWERWDGIETNGSFEDPEMNSFNHYAYGSIDAWMYGVAAGIGIDPAAPGYKHIRIEPRPGGGLTFVRATEDSEYGEIISSWAVDGDTFSLTVRIPPNTRATVRLPDAELGAVKEGDHPLAGAAGIEGPGQAGSAVVLQAGSGLYTFTYPSPGLARSLEDHAPAGSGI